MPAPFVPTTFSGSVLFVMLASPVDLSPWVAHPLQLVDPHHVFLKVYRLRTRPVPGAPKPPAYSQYTQACITVLAAPPGHEPGQHNLVLWEEREWTIGPDQIGWHKKLVDIEVADASPEYLVDVHVGGRPLLSVRASLDGTPGVADPGIAGGFFGVTYDDESERSGVVSRVDVADLVLTEPVTGTGSVELVESSTYEPEENALVRALQSATVTGVALRTVKWTRADPAPAFFPFAAAVQA
jgi:Acetoacetate decarboxylase (ADC)